MARTIWTRAETVLAFALYCRLPFGRLHARTQEIISVAKKLNRSANSVAMKCCNLASLDSTHRARGVKGLNKASTVDRELWSEFESNPDSVLFEAATAYGQLDFSITRVSDPELEQLEGTDRERLVRVRVNQYFFRELILSGYGERCAVCTLPIPQLLVASHIVPWAVDPSLRLNPRNGLCLCGTHDLAFERGFLRVHQDFSIEIAVPANFQTSASVKDWLVRFDGARLELPQRWTPDPRFLERKLAFVNNACVPRQ